MDDLRVRSSRSPRLLEIPMTDYVTLLGAEQVQSAARSIRESAQMMQGTASQMEHALDQHWRRMEELVSRLEDVGRRSVAGD